MQRGKGYVILFSVCLLISFAKLVHAEQKNQPSKVVNEYFQAIDQQNWYAIPNLWVKHEDLLGFIQNKQNQKEKNGFFRIEKAKVKYLKEVPYSYASQYLPTRYIEKFKNPRVFYVGVDYKVYKENQYQLNGVNYFFVTTVLEEGMWKIVTETIPPISSLIKDGYGFGTDDEKTYDERRMKYLN
ncbi:hypothetical protein [Gottfriedia solisilvae]|uniref:hypothetical protein n=1 Tax=Gottfriedia solisilvae TaxID=1516104 RepID=UPI003D2F4128